MVAILRTVRGLQLPDCWVSAGFVRNTIWDALHGYPVSGKLNDLDVIYFSPDNLGKDLEKALEAKLRALLPAYHWSVKNQARMHLHNHETPYQSSTDAMAHWPETATAIGVRLNARDHVELAAPYGVDDLVQLRVRVSPRFTRNIEIYRQRIREKEWLEKWPRLQIEWES